MRSSIVATWILLAVGSCALPSASSDRHATQPASSNDVADDPRNQDGSATLPPSPPPPIPAAFAADLAADSTAAPDQPPDESLTESFALLLSILDPSLLSFDLMGGVFLDPGDGSDLLSLTFDAFLLDSLIPSAGSGFADDFTFLELLCREGDTPDFICRQRFGP